ncbi:MAG: type II secretion system protein [bacterium]
MTEKNKGFTLTEILVYAATLLIIISAVFPFIFLGMRSGAKAKALREVMSSANYAREIISREIRGAKSIYTPTSNSGQLSLETTKYLQALETESYIDFYLCQERICFKKEGQLAQPLTSDNVRASNLVFTRANQDSVRFSFQVDYKNQIFGNTASINVVSAAVLR